MVGDCASGTSAAGFGGASLAFSRVTVAERSTVPPAPRSKRMRTWNADALPAETGTPKSSPVAVFMWVSRARVCQLLHVVPSLDVRTAMAMPGPSASQRTLTWVKGLPARSTEEVYCPVVRPARRARAAPETSTPSSVPVAKSVAERGRCSMSTGTMGSGAAETCRGLRSIGAAAMAAEAVASLRKARRGSGLCSAGMQPVYRAVVKSAHRAWHLANVTNLANSQSLRWVRTTKSQHGDLERLRSL